MTVSLKGLSVPARTTWGSTAWLPWPNRPFVRSAELTLVPQAGQTDIVGRYWRPAPSQSGTVGVGFGIPGSQAAIDVAGPASPVGFEPGRDHNVKDCIRVRRMIE